jgi:rhamnosyltransferase
MILPEKYNVCAVVTSYYPNEGFTDRLFRISKQVDKIVVIDNNSDAPVLALLEEVSRDLKIHTIFNSDNLGVATALNQGIRWAKINDYSWVLLLDQDTVISDNLVEVLCGCYQKMTNKEQIGIIGPGYFDLESRKYFTHPIHGDTYIYNEVKSVITSGSLMSTDIFEIIGPFRDDLFIDFIDIEYCLRARARGFKIIKVHTHLMQHSIGSVSMHRLPWKITGTSNHSPLRRYYMMRNNILIVKEYFLIYPGWAITSLFGRVKSTLLMIFFEKQRIQKLKYSALGVIDGISGKVNRIIK